jgi:hypothetical protein
MQQTQISMFNQNEIASKRNKIERIKSVPDEKHINDIIKRQMPIFEENCLSYHMKATLEVLQQAGIKDLAVIGEIQLHFLDIKDDILTIFRSMDDDEKDSINRKYQDVCKYRSNYGLMDD